MSQLALRTLVEEPRPVGVELRARNPNGDCDFNDFIVTAQAEATESVPEPATLAGLGAVAAGFVVSRRRRKAA
ncbi:MAG: PEP-CTERM sorting domain-containing protein [Leptolyngbyaceae cyanobacterium RM2_2_4]|nr:PEP-CTERM sorting domain-containing protein [Leptolyngbyaceae cyanobacterium RM2_2_4]